MELVINDLCIMMLSIISPILPGCYLKMVYLHITRPNFSKIWENINLSESHRCIFWKGILEPSESPSKCFILFCFKFISVSLIFSSVPPAPANGLSMPSCGIFTSLLYDSNGSNLLPLICFDDVILFCFPFDSNSFCRFQ